MGADQLLARGARLSRWARRSESRRLLVRRSVRWLRMSSRIRGWIAGQMLVRRSRLVAGPPGCSSSGRTSPIADMSSTGTTTWRSSLRVPASTTGHISVRSDPAEEPGDRLERPLRGGQSDPLHRASGGGGVVAQGLEPLEAERQVGPALGARDGVDLIDDDVLHAAQALACGTGEHQVERFGGRDEDVGRVAGDLPAVVGRRVAGPAGDRDVRHGFTETLCGQGDPGERRPEVPLDVVGQGLERRDVEHADETGRLARRHRARMGRQTIERPKERREGFPATGGCVDERMVRRWRWRPSRAPARRSALRSSPGTSHGRRARKARADRR